MEGLKEEFEWYADWAAEVSSLYERIARGIAETPDILSIAADAAQGQPAPQLLLGAVHALLLEGTDHPLAAFYPTCTETPKDPREEDPFPSFRDFCLSHEDRIREIVSSRRVQTNDVGRSAVLLPAFEYVSRVVERRPLALIEIGASAGLNLYWDRYRYEYAGYGGVGDPDSPVRIESAICGDRTPPLPDTLPSVVHRVGNDLNPLDVTESDNARWLRALVIPDQQFRYERLAAAIDLVRASPPELVAGDAIEVLADLLPEAPTDAALCIFSTLTLYQLSKDGIADLRERLTEHSYDRPIHWLSGAPDTDREYPTYRYVRLTKGTTTETHLAEYKSYGEWIRWLADETPGSPG